MQQLSYEAREFMKQRLSDLVKAKLSRDASGRLMNTKTKDYSQSNIHNPEGINGRQRRRVIDDDGTILIHGTRTSYGKGKCRCPECRQRHFEEMAKTYKRPCIKGCGRLSWHRKKNSGMCVTCSRIERKKAVQQATSPTSPA